MRRLHRGSFSGRDSSGAAFAAQLCSQAVHQSKNLRLGSCICERGNRFSTCGVLYSQVNSNLAINIQIGAQHHEVAPQVSVHTCQRFSCQTVGIRQRKISLHARNGLPGHGAQLFSRAKFSGEHLRQGGREPRLFRPTREILESDNSDGSAWFGGTTRARFQGFPHMQEVSSDREHQQEGGKSGCQ